MKRRSFYLTVLTVAALGAVTARAVADDAARTWSQSMGYSSASQQATDFNKAQVEYLLRNGITPGAAVTNCQTAGSCQNGGTATNVSGYAQTNVNGSTGTTITVDVDSDANQDASSTTADDIGNLDIH